MLTQQGQTSLLANLCDIIVRYSYGIAVRLSVCLSLSPFFRPFLLADKHSCEVSWKNCVFLYINM